MAVPVYEPHPITRDIALTFFPGIRSLTLLPPPPGVTSTPLFLSSPRELHAPGRADGRAPARARAAARRRPAAERPRPAAAASPRRSRARGPARAAGSAPFRLVVVGDGDFASNSFLPYMAQQRPGAAMVRWAAREERRPRSRCACRCRQLMLLTKSQMQRIFLALEVFLPLGVVAVGAVVWWRRR